MPRDRVASVLAIAVRTAKDGPMREVAAAAVRADGGIEGDVPSPQDRGVTFLAAPQWREVVTELGADLPWYTRRANVLVDAAALSGWIGRVVSVGDARIRIMGESRPCDVMERLRAGLKSALARDCRGGVYGRVTQDGTIRVGDRVEIE